jgi:hypothetical protein
MRSIVLPSSVLILSIAAFACSSSTNGTGTQQAASSSDGGTTTKKPVKIGGGTSSSGGTKTPAKEADAGGVMPDPTPGLLPTCKGAALCVNDCPDNDEACFAACMKGMPADEAAKFEAVGVCINNSGCETEAQPDVCVQEVCGAEINACLGE